MSDSRKKRVLRRMLRTRHDWQWHGLDVIFASRARLSRRAVHVYLSRIVAWGLLVAPDISDEDILELLGRPRRSLFQIVL